MSTVLTTILLPVDDNLVESAPLIPLIKICVSKESIWVIAVGLTDGAREGSFDEAGASVDERVEAGSFVGSWVGCSVESLDGDRVDFTVDLIEGIDEVTFDWVVVGIELVGEDVAEGIVVGLAENGFAVGSPVGECELGFADSIMEGVDVGEETGPSEGAAVGTSVGIEMGLKLGVNDGVSVFKAVVSIDGDEDISTVAALDGDKVGLATEESLPAVEGCTVGEFVGNSVGRYEGSSVVPTE